ncbi:MAG: LysM peptidoglycan-binding domain-containing protein [Phycisphaerae bacterium]|nr:LysM peptidoglycan-binding domain-containing protein [Phycisphaerae bacterium]
MTADAKVGLLLGLIFIVVIAFLINGLPNFLRTASAEESFNTQIEIPTAPDLVIDNPVVQTAQHLQNDVPLRWTTPPDQIVVLDDLSPSSNGVEQRISPEQIAPVSVQVPNISVEPETVQDTIAEPRYHVIQSGENLPVIAKKYYGAEDGNRRIVIQKLYEANHDVLDSPDKICVNDKLIIPPLEELLNGSPRTSSVPVTGGKQNSLLARFSNLFEPVTSDEPVKLYVVQEGESLWGIAEKTLGDGKRYKEILKVNRSIKDADDVRAGMNLRIPQK